MLEFFNDPTVRTAAATLVVALMLYFSALLQRMSSRVNTIEIGAAADRVVLGEVNKATAQIETQVNSQKTALEGKIMLLEAKLEAAVTALVLQHAAAVGVKDQQIAKLSGIAPVLVQPELRQQ